MLEGGGIIYTTLNTKNILQSLKFGYRQHLVKYNKKPIH